MLQRRAGLAAVLVLAAACSGGGGASRPTLSSFTATPTRVAVGHPVTLTWSVSGADALDLQPDVGPVTGDTWEVSPTETTTYRLTATNAQGSTTLEATVTVLPADAVRVGYLHHSTGGVIWDGGGGLPVDALLQAYDDAHGTHYEVTSVTYPDTTLGVDGDDYPWANYPYDYWNLWVRHTGQDRDRGEQNLDDLALQYDVIVFKHCFPVSAIGPDDGDPRVDSAAQTLANYELQYDALKERMRGLREQHPALKFLVWTGAALRQDNTSEDEARRARDFFTWVKATWDEPGDNIFVWDFRALEVPAAPDDLYLRDDYSAGDSHPNAALAARAAPAFVNRLVDVIEGRGDSGSLTGE